MYYQTKMYSSGDKVRFMVRFFFPIDLLPKTGHVYNIQDRFWGRECSFLRLASPHKYNMNVRELIVIIDGRHFFCFSF